MLGCFPTIRRFAGAVTAADCVSEVFQAAIARLQECFAPGATE
jgi:hypothetical protein